MLHKEFFSGRTPPKVHPRSTAAIEFWREQVQRCLHGFEYKGTRITKWQYFLINFMYMDVVIPGTKDTHLGLPNFAQADDYLFKQIEEAEQSDLGAMLFTARGFGKSYDMTAIGAHTTTFYPNALTILSSSAAKPSEDLFKKADTALGRLPAALRHNRMVNKALEEITMGIKYIENGEELKKGFLSSLTRVTYGDNPGKTRGTRPKKQIFEEIGAWTESAGLIDCYMQSMGSFFRGSIMTGQPLLIGTGGQMKSGATKEAKEMYNNPEAFRLYAVENPRLKKKTAIFIPATIKREGFYEKTGESDEVGAMENIQTLRKSFEKNPAAYNQFVQEFPLNEDEMFTVSGTNRFNQINIARQTLRLQNEERFRDIIEKGNLEWIRDKRNKITGVKWEPDAAGMIEIVKGEHPRKTPDGADYRNLYIGGLDSIDQGTGDSMGTDGSKLCLMIKKRFLTVEDTSDMYVCKYTERPRDPNTAFENVLKILWYYNCRVNLEYTKITIVPYFKARHQYWRFIQRPAIALADKNNEKYTTLIGTQMTTPIITHMNLRLQDVFEFHCEKLLFKSVLEQGRDYQPDDQTDYDEIVAMGLCELADEDMAELLARPDQTKVVKLRQNIGYYVDAMGIKRHGVIPQQKDIFDVQRTQSARSVSVVDGQYAYADY